MSGLNIWNERRINQILDFSGISIWSLSPGDGLFHLSEHSKKLLEVPAGHQLSLENFNELFEESNFTYWLETFKHSWTCGTFDATLRLKTFKGNWIWAKVKSTSEVNAQGEPVLILGTLQDITENKEQEIILRRQKTELERNHRLLIKAEQIGKLGHWTLSRKNNVFALSNEAQSICGLQNSPEPHPAMNRYINPDGINWAVNSLPKPGTYVHQIRLNSKTKKWVEVNVDGNSEDSESIFGTIQDITNEIKSKKEALLNEARQKAIIDAIPNAFFYTDPKGKILQVNKAFRQFFNIGKPVGHDLYDLIDFADKEGLAAKDELLFLDKESPIEIVTTVKLSGTVKTVKIYKNNFKNIAGETLGLIGLIFDMSEEVKRNAKVLLANKQLNLAIGGANAGFFIYDIKKDINYWDEKTSEMFGFAREPQVGVIDDFFAVLHPEDRERLKSEKKANYRGIKKIDNHYRILKKGEVRYINAQGVVERNEKGTPVRILGIHFDETDRLLAQQKLIEGEKKYRRMFESIKDGYLMIDLTGKIIDANPSAAFLLGYKKPGSLVGKNFAQLCRKRVTNLINLRDELKKGASLRNVKIEMTTRGGEAIIADFHANLNTYDGNSLIEATFRDVTEEILTQDRILTATINAEDSQRRRIAQALHDSVQQLLITSKINFESFRALQPHISGDQQQKFDLGLKFLSEGLHETRAVAHELIPATVEDFGIHSAIESFVTYLNRSTETQFHFNSNLQNSRFNNQVEISLYRILQEATNNIIKYSKASEAQIQLVLKGKKLTLTIEDDGIGFDLKTASMHKSFGITGMRTRATSIGAFFEIDSRINRGTMILVEVKV